MQSSYTIGIGSGSSVGGLGTGSLFDVNEAKNEVGEKKRNKTRTTLQLNSNPMMITRAPCHYKLMCSAIEASPDELDSPPASPGKTSSPIIYTKTNTDEPPGKPSVIVFDHSSDANNNDGDTSLVVQDTNSGDEDEFFKRDFTITSGPSFPSPIKTSSPTLNYKSIFDTDDDDDDDDDKEHVQDQEYFFPSSLEVETIQSLDVDKEGQLVLSFSSPESPEEDANRKDDELWTPTLDTINEGEEDDDLLNKVLSDTEHILHDIISPRDSISDNYHEDSSSSSTVFEITPPSKNVNQDQLVLSSPEPEPVKATRKRGRGKPKGPQLKKPKKEKPQKPKSPPASKPVKGKKGKNFTKKRKINKKSKKEGDLDAELDDFRTLTVKTVEIEDHSSVSVADSSEPEAPDDYRRRVKARMQRMLGKKEEPSTSTPKNVKINKKAKKCIDEKIVKKPKAIDSLEELENYRKSKGKDDVHILEKFFSRNKDSDSNPKKIIVDGEEIDDTESEDDDPRGKMFFGKGLKRKKNTPRNDLSDSDSGPEEMEHKPGRYDRDIDDNDDDDYEDDVF